MSYERSEEIGAFAKAFAAAQGQFGPVLKERANDAFKAGGKASRYADLAAVVDAVLPALNAQGIGVRQFVSASADQEGCAVCRTVLMHESGQWESSVTTVPVSKRDAQGYGSAFTYARRYSLLAVTGAAPEDDDGNAASAPRPAPAQQPPAQPPKPATLAERMATAIKAMQDADSAAAVDRAYDRAKGLRDDLDRTAPDLLAGFEAAHKARLADFDQPALKAAA